MKSFTTTFFFVTIQTHNPDSLHARLEMLYNTAAGQGRRCNSGLECTGTPAPSVGLGGPRLARCVTGVAHSFLTTVDFGPGSYPLHLFFLDPARRIDFIVVSLGLRFLAGA